MNEKDYFEKMKKLRIVYLKELYELKSNFALSKTIYKSGDIIEDHYHRIKIIKAIDFHEDKNYIPTLIFSGIELTKKNIPKKKQSATNMYEISIKRKIEVAVIEKKE